MSLISSLNRHQKHKATIYALKKLLLYESDDDKTHLLSLLHQINIETDSIECDNQNSKSSSTSYTNYNNSYVPIETEKLSTLDAHYQIDSQIYLPPDLQLYKTLQPSFHPSHSYLQPSRLQNSSLLEQQRNSSQKSRSSRQKQKRLRSNRNRKNNNSKQQETTNFHYRNMITVRRISCHDILDSQMMMKKQFKYKQNKLKNEKIKNEWKQKITSANLIENKSQKYKNFPTEFKSSIPPIEPHTSSIQSTMSKSLVSPSTTNTYTKTFTTPISNTLFQQQELKKNMSNSVGMTGFKVTSLRDSSASSLMSTQLIAATYNQMKPDVTITTTNTPGSQIDFGSLPENSSHLSTNTGSIVPHFSSTPAPHVSHHISSSTMTIPNVSKIESITNPNSTNENIQDLVDQLKTCIATLSLLLQNKTEDEKHRISNVKSYSDEKRNRKSQSSSSSLSLISTPDRLRFSKESISNENNLGFEDITVRRCNSSNDQERKKYQNNIPALYNNQHEELKRCLLVYCRDQANKDRDRNINSNENQKNSHCTWNDLTSNEHLSLSQSSQSIANNSIDVLSVSQSTLILAEEDDEYEPLNELSRVSSL